MEKIAKTDSTILVMGESGTGKELIAREIHLKSPRKGEFVSINCGALPDNLLESELFGYKAGAFTDAKRDKPGRFARAEGGTLLLDEIGDVSPALQVRLLRVLQEKRYEPLGGTQSVKVDVRIVAATNKDLETAIADGSFREDLFYRLNVIPLHIPPLRERSEDIPALVDAFVQSVGTAQCITGVSDALRARHPGVLVVAVEPSESAVLSGGVPGPHKIEGVGPGFVPPRWREGLADEIQQVSTTEAKEMTRRLAKEEALFAGTSSGANVVAALRVAQRFGPDRTVATLVCDSGLKYLSTDLYSTA